MSSQSSVRSKSPDKEKKRKSKRQVIDVDSQDSRIRKEKPIRKSASPAIGEMQSIKNAQAAQPLKTNRASSPVKPV
jgi:hypothetical protein